MPEPVVKIFERMSAHDIALVYTPLPLHEIAAHPLVLRSNLSKLGRRRVAEEAAAAWVVTSEAFEDPDRPAAVVVWFREFVWTDKSDPKKPVERRWPFIQPRGAVNKTVPTPGAIVFRDGRYVLLDEKDPQKLDDTVLPIVTSTPTGTSLPPEVRDKDDLNLI
ncbi:hypothetical protein ASG63_16330 [Methylobacterium sp. Leaf94]|nr:hypothetical protein ASG63_16330 [Methylobacterium sp. Leaf94]